MICRRLAAALVLMIAAAAVLLLRTGDRAPEQRQVASASAGAPAGTDVHYAEMMVTHHEQAIRMSRTLIAKGGVPERIRLIADFIIHDQQREIDQTNDWLTAWGEPPAEPSPDPRSSPATDGGAAPGRRSAPPADGAAAHGMLTGEQLGELDRADARTAPAVFLRLMIDHHRGAITMSEALLDGPAGNVYVHSLAKHVVNEQSAEIDAMAALLRP